MKRSKNKIPKSFLKYSSKKLFWKDVANLQKNIHAEMFLNLIEITHYTNKYRKYA